MNYPAQQPLIQPAKSDYERIADLIDQRSTKRSTKTMLEFAPTCKITTGKTRGQNVSLEKAPYSKRVFELMDPGHKCQILANMWSSQSMKSVSAQIAMAYYTIEDPREILCVSSDEKMVKKVMDRRYSPMVQELGVRFISSFTSKGNKKTGDTTLSKEFPGGNIDATTANSSAGLASETKGFALLDEISLYGNKSFEKQSEAYYDAYARLKTYLEEKKMLVVSTPGDDGICMMQKIFLWGTQEEWWVPCKKCGTYQILEVANPDGYGLDWRTSKGGVIESSIVYVCKHCAKSFTEKSKFEIQLAGEWRKPEDVTPIDEYTYSLHLHSINSNFERWREIAKAFEAGRDDQTAKKNYDNHVAGMPHKISGHRIEAHQVMKNRGEYPSKTVPDGVLYLTMFADVQRGSDRWADHTHEEIVEIADEYREKGLKSNQNYHEWELHELKLPRLEFEILGIGPRRRTWSIDYQVIYGRTDNAFGGAFERLNDYSLEIIAKNGGFGFKREKDGMYFPVSIIFIDSGYNSSVVYQFTQRWGNCFPSKGERTIKPAKNSKDFHLHQSFHIPYRVSKVGPGGSLSLYTIGTKLYKRDMYSHLSVERIEGDIQNPYFCDFPRETTLRFFQGITAEEKTVDDEYDNKGRYNEPTDCRTGNMCAADVWLTNQVEAWREKFKKEKKYTDAQLQKIGPNWVINYMATARKIDPGFLVSKK